MRILLCIDDTDNLESIGTGHHAQDLREKIESNNLGKTYFISRHQLYVHNDVPYTSHNSAMCFEADIEESDLQKVIELSQKHLIEVSAPGSDPGLCVAVKDRILNPPELIAYGKKAKCSLLTKEDAYEMARKQDIHLSEHGGDGQGVVGALAGLALRYYGNDGRIKGKVEVGKEGEILTAKEIKEIVKCDNIICLSSEVLKDDDKIILSEEKVKSILLGWKNTLLVTNVDGIYRTLKKKEHKCY